MTTQISYSFDVGTVLGLGIRNADPLPEAGEGEIILRVPDGISLQSLRESDIGNVLLYRQDWYDTHTWAKTALPDGTYRLRLPIPKSNNKTFSEQQKLLLEGESVAPVTLLTLVLLCFKKQNLPDPLTDGWFRCQETAGDARVELAWRDGRLRVYNYWGDGRGAVVWAAGSRTS